MWYPLQTWDITTQKSALPIAKVIPWTNQHIYTHIHQYTHALHALQWILQAHGAQKKISCVIMYYVIIIMRIINEYVLWIWKVGITFKIRISVISDSNIRYIKSWTRPPAMVQIWISWYYESELLIPFFWKWYAHSQIQTQFIISHKFYYKYIISY